MELNSSEEDDDNKVNLFKNYNSVIEIISRLLLVPRQEQCWYRLCGYK